MITPADALVFIEEIQNRLTIVPLDGNAYLETMNQSASMNLMGGQLYDALILKAAERVKAKSILTWNIGQFRRIAPSLANRIRTP